MKIRTNFADGMPWLVPTLAWGGAVLAVAGLSVTVMLVVGGWHDRAGLPRLQQHLATLVKRARAAPPAREKSIGSVALRGVSERVHAVNDIPGQSGGAVRAVLAEFEHDLPTGARLVSLRYNDARRQWELVAESRKEDELTNFLNRLEDARFTSAMLRKQSEIEGNHGMRTQVELVVQE